MIEEERELSAAEVATYRRVPVAQDLELIVRGYSDSGTPTVEVSTFIPSLSLAMGGLAVPVSAVDGLLVAIAQAAEGARE